MTHCLDPLPVNIEGELEYKVEEILDKCIHWHWMEYLIKWKGYPLYDMT